MIDLHTHSNISDGFDTPETLIEHAKDLNLFAVALTDHDSIDGLKRANTEADRHGVRMVNGIELSVFNGKGRLIHILGLGLNLENETFMKMYNDYRIRREKYLDHVFDALHKRNLPITPEAAMEYASGGRLDRQAVCKWLLNKGYVDNLYYAWVDYVDHVEYMEEEACGKEEAFAMIEAAGGKSFMAHFNKQIGMNGYNSHERIAFLKYLKGMGLDGIERYYSEFTSDEEAEAQFYMDKLGLLASGGSDYHGEYRKGAQLGTGSGNLNVPNQLLDNILIKRQKSS